MSESPEHYVKNPGKDFTRKRKLYLKKMLQLLISMGGNSINKELLESTDYDVNTATSSAFVQQRDKILPRAFEYLLHKFTQSYSNIKKYRRYRLLAVDGSDLHIPTNPEDTDTHYNSNPNGNGHSHTYLQTFPAIVV
jgi:ribosomal protein S18